MNKENNTEKIISDKLNGREFAFDEKAWESMETLLDSEEKKKKRGIFWYFSASMFIVLLAGAAYYFISEPETASKKLVLDNLPVEKQVINGHETRFDDKTNQAKEETENTLVTGNPEQNQVKEGLKNEIKNTATTQNGTESLSVAGKTSGRKNETAFANSQLPGANSMNQKNAPGNSGQSSENPGAGTLNPGDDMKKAEKPPVSSQGLIESKSETEFVQTEAAAEKIAAADSVKQVEQRDTLSLPESQAAAKNPLAAPGKETKNAWGIIAGTGAWKPYQSTDGATNWKGGFPFTAGICYQRTLSKRFDLGLSVLYCSRGALNFDKTFINADYGFGLESDKTIISPQTLHYLNVPLSIRFNISQRSHIYTGAAYYQLIATTSKVTHVTESSLGVTESATEKQSGEHKGFRKNDIVIFLGYELTLFDRMNAGLQINYGFYDATVDTYYPTYTNKYDRNIGIQLLLKYDLIRH